MCRSIRILYHCDPPVTEPEIRAASLQFVRKISGMNKPSRANAEEFDRAVEEIALVSQRLLQSLTTSAPVRTRK